MMAAALRALGSILLLCIIGVAEASAQGHLPGAALNRLDHLAGKRQRLADESVSLALQLDVHLMTGGGGILAGGRAGDQQKQTS